MNNYSTSRVSGVTLVIGTRAELIKVAPVMQLMQEREVPFRFVYTNQHGESLRGFIDEFNVKRPDYVVVALRRASSQTLRSFINWLVRVIRELIFYRRRIIPSSDGIVLVHGDTTTTVLGSILGKLTRNKVVHIEAGLRSGNLLSPFPEEVNRRIVSKLADVHFCPGDEAIENLKRYRGKKINTRANTLYDTVQFVLQQNGRDTSMSPDEKYAVASIHRFENIASKKRLARIVEVIESAAQKFPIIFILHPVTENYLKKHSLWRCLTKNSSILIRPKLPFTQFIRLLSKAEFVITDGGSNQQELSYLGKPTLVMRDVTETREGLGENAVLAGIDRKEVVKFMTNYRTYEVDVKKLLFSPSKIVVDWITQRYP